MTFKEKEIADGLEAIAKADRQTSEFYNRVLNETADLLRHCWVLNKHDCKKYLSTKQFETLEGFIKKIDVLRVEEYKNEKEK